MLAARELLKISHPLFCSKRIAVQATSKLGSSKAAIREAAHNLLVSQLQQASPKSVLSCLTIAPTSSNIRVRLKAIEIFDKASLACELLPQGYTLAMDL